MLAGQRLRRAATYAADRTYLRQLIELPVLATTQAELVTAETNREATSAQAAPAQFANTTNPTLTNTPKILDYQGINPFEDKPDQIISQAEILAAIPAAEADEEEAELPVQAPPIRPPAEAKAVRSEFGLAEQEPAEIMAYRLPELPELAAPANEAPAPVTSWLPVFRGIPEVSYAPIEGSRLGWCLVIADTTELRPSASLPSAGEFFAPDALLLTHLTTHQPPTAFKPSPISLIDSFLQRAPAATRRRILPSLAATEPAAQADLSVRSTRAEPDLTSESLAKILVRQGKIDRAIAVYERLMVKHPERMAYFAAQIESLRPSA